MVQKKGGTVLSAASLSINKVLDGMDSFLYIRFSEFPDGRNMSSEPNEKTKYIGVVSTKENRPPSDPARYAWTAFKGADGEKTFLWVRYSEQDGGKPKMESNPSAKTQYMGVYSGPETTAPTDATRYRWVKTKGEQGESSYLHVRYSDYADGAGFYEKPKRTTMFIGVAVTVSEKAPVNKEAYDWAEFGVNIEFGGRNYILESLAPVVIKKQSSRKWMSAYPSSRFSKDWPGYTGFAVATIHGYTSGTAYPENVRMRLVGLKGTSRVYEEEFVIPQSELKKKEFEHSHVFIIPESASTANSYLLEVYSWTENMELEIDRIKLERGNRPTDWSGAPEDVSSEMMEIKKESASLGVLIQKLESGKASTAELQALATELSGYVKSNTSYGGVKITDQGVLLDSTNMEVVLDQRNGFLIKTKKPGQTVLQVDKDGKFIINASNLNTEIEDTKKEIDKKIDEIEYGGRNYALNSARVVGTKKNSSNESYFEDYLREAIIPGGEVVLSMSFCYEGFKERASGQNRLGVEIAVSHIDGTTTWIGVWDYPSSDRPSKSGRVARKLKIKDVPIDWEKTVKGAKNPRLGYYFQALFEHAEITKVKLESGTVQTDWTPAPEDTIAQIESINLGTRNLLQKRLWYTSSGSTKFEFLAADGSEIIASFAKGTNWPRVHNSSVREVEWRIGEDYTLAFEAKMDKAGHSGISAQIADGASRRSIAKFGNLELTEEYQRFSFTFTHWQNIDMNDVTLQFFVWSPQDMPEDRTMWLKNVKLERGNRASDWTPAPEDSGVYQAWANSPDGRVDFTRDYPNENLLIGTSFEEQEVSVGGWGDYRDYEIENSETLMEDGLLKTGDSFTLSLFLDASQSKYPVAAFLRAPTKTNPYRDLRTNWIDAGKKGYAEFSGEVPDDAISLSLRVIRFNQSDTPAQKVSYSKVKIEKGLKRTPYIGSVSEFGDATKVMRYRGLSTRDANLPSDYTWQDSPEYTKAYMEQGLGNKVDTNEYETDREEIQTSLGDKASKDELKEIEDLANQIQDEYEEFIKDGGRYEADLESLENRISAMVMNLGDKIAEFNFINKYIKLGEEGLLLGDSTSLMNILISDKRISFFDGGKEVAYMEGQEFRINRGTILESLQVGSHKMEQVDANSTIFTFIS